MANEMKVSNRTQHETSERNCKQSEHTNMATFYINQTSKDESIKEDSDYRERRQIIHWQMYT